MVDSFTTCTYGTTVIDYLDYMFVPKIRFQQDAGTKHQFSASLSHDVDIIDIKQLFELG